MFTVDQIRASHSKVKSGADFPAYIKEIKQLGVMHYETFVSDGHTDLFGSGNYKITMPAKYELLAVAETSDSKRFKLELKEHQQGKTDYLTFIGICAKCGIEKWIAQIDEMTCTYYDAAGLKILAEQIPH